MELQRIIPKSEKIIFYKYNINELYQFQENNEIRRKKYINKKDYINLMTDDGNLIANVCLFVVGCIYNIKY